MSAHAAPDAHLDTADAGPEKRPEGVSVRWQVEKYRPLLLVLARKAGFAARLKNKLDSSDVVQEAVLRALKDQDAFKGATEAEWIGWLQNILTNTFIDACRNLHAQKRNVDLEEPLLGMMAQSTARLEGYLVDKKNPPPNEDAERREFLVRLAGAIEELPEDQRDVVMLRDLLETPVDEIAERLGKTGKAVAGLLLRGRRKLRERLADLL